MKFLDQVGEGITGVGKGAKQKAKDMADIARLNRTISEADQRITQLYTAIGKAYYRAHRQDPQAEMADSISEINSLRNDIYWCKEQIKQIKGVTKCPKCGNDVMVNAAFCSVCGAPIPAAQMPEAPADSKPQRSCPKCGRPVADDDLFCNYCGTKVDA